MVDVRVQVDGLDRLRRALKAAEPGTEHELRSSLKESAELVAASARERCPVGHRFKPAGVSHLRDTIKIGVLGARARIFSKSPYANIIHWGGDIPSIDSLSKRPKRHFTGRPFIEQAVEAEQDAFVERLNHNLGLLYERLGL